MSIFFSCECGNRLKAREKMAGRLSFCPRCGTSVRIPALEPTHSGIEENPKKVSARSITSEEKKPTREELISRGSSRVSRRLNRTDEIVAAPSKSSKAIEAAGATNASEIALVSRKKKRWRKKRKPIEYERWGQRLIFPFRDYKALLGIAGYFTLTGSLFLILFPDAQQNDSGKLSLRPVVWGGALPFFAIGLAYCGALFNRVLFFTLVGHGDEEHIPKLKLSSAIDSFLFWSVAFFAGPFVLFLLALLYWIECGQIDVWDVAIMGELLCGGIAWWILTVLGNSHRLQKIPLNPVTTFRALKLFGGKAVLSALAICPILVGTAYLGTSAASNLEQSAFLGVSLFFVASFLFLYAMQVALRTIGISYFKAKAKADMEKEV